MVDKEKVLQERKDTRLKKAEELLQEALLQLEYLEEKFTPTGTTANIKSRIETFLETTIAPICTYSGCLNEREPIKETITTGMWFGKLLGNTPKKLKIIGYKDYCSKHCDWFNGGLE